MTLTELQKELGAQIEILTDKNIDPSKRSEYLQTAQAVSALAKNMINNADIVLRSEKMIAQNLLTNSKIEQML